MAAQHLSEKFHDKQLQKIKDQWKKGDRQNAVNQCQEILRSAPQYAPAHLIYAGFLSDSGNAQEAAKHYEAACSLPETAPECFLGFADFLKRGGQRLNAQEVLSVGVKKWPKTAVIARELGLLLSENDQHHQALQMFEHCLKLHPDDWICWNHLGCSRVQNNHAETALECFDKSLALITKSPLQMATGRDIENIELNKASALIHAGKTEVARRMLEEILAKTPESHRAWPMLAKLIKCSPEQLEQMEICVQNAQNSGDEDALRDLHFALGRAWDNVKDPKKSMTHLDAGNRIVRSKLDYDSFAVCDRIRHTTDFFPPKTFINIEKQSQPNKLNLRPIFIVGMPRSGSTLTEQIIASHPQIIGAGELTALPMIKKRLLGTDFPSRPEHRALAHAAETISQLRKAYLDEIARVVCDLHPDHDLEKDQFLVVDKMLGNFDMIGMILQAIPEAQIIHCRRNKIDTCLSCYSMRFSSPVNYSYDQKELAEFYNAYEEQMKYWHAHVPPSSLIESRYEDMIADTEGQARKLLDFIGMPWDSKVLDFYKQKRTVGTASMSQVRKPIYKSSVERWRPFEPYIRPMLDILAEDG
tara:strand:- start:888 stop:2642 length:1755 start_codon:yes stop_codon:yes gene_type:complete